MKAVIASQDFPSGTSLQGEIRADFAKLVEIFGEPERVSGDKIQVEWLLRFEDGTFAMIYDWKNYGRDAATVTTWHVGGLDSKSLDRVSAALGIRY